MSAKTSWFGKRVNDFAVTKNNIFRPSRKACEFQFAHAQRKVVGACAYMLGVTKRRSGRHVILRVWTMDILDERCDEKRVPGAASNSCRGSRVNIR